VTFLKMSYVLAPLSWFVCDLSPTAPVLKACSPLAALLRGDGSQALTSSVD
jgi:hypothetical protein